MLERPKISIEDMYVRTKNLSPFGIKEYQVSKKYEDPIKICKDKEYLIQKKGQPPKIKIPKKKSFFEDEQEKSKKIPGPQYQIQDLWPTKSAKSKNPANLKSRQSYLTEIEKRSNSPGPGKYEIFQNVDQQIKEQEENRRKKIAKTESTKGNYLNELEYLSNANPGPGSYNPYIILPKIKAIPVKSEATSKHQNHIEKSSFPDMGSYHPVDVDSFQKLLEQKQQGKDQKKVFFMGKQSRFNEIVYKQKGKEPGPGEYSMIAEWKGKEEKKQSQTKRNYMDSISKNISRSIYY